MCRIDPLDFAKESLQLIDLIDKLTLNQPILQPPPQGRAYAGRQPGAAPSEFPTSLPCASVMHFIRRSLALVPSLASGSLVCRGACLKILSLIGCRFGCEPGPAA